MTGTALPVHNPRRSLASGAGGGINKTMRLFGLVLICSICGIQWQRLSLQARELSMATSRLDDQLSEIRQLQQKLQLQQQEYESQLQTTKAALASAESSVAAEAPPELNVQNCRHVFGSQGQGGMGEQSYHKIKQACEDVPGKTIVYNVCDDLRDFTGLQETEFLDRMARKGRFHFEGEHAFWDPQSATELAWYYSTSVNYLFANALHGVNLAKIDPLVTEDKRYEPVLDYSGGVGNNVIHLATKAIKCQYFGIGMMEYRFAEYRVARKGLMDNVEFIQPQSERTNFKFDPINAALPRDGSLGSIIAMDVLEHIPNYHVVVQAMVESLKVGGRIVEQTPFGNTPNSEGEDLRVHLSNGGVDMKTAMGPKMKLEGRVWVKQEP